MKIRSWVIIWLVSLVATLLVCFFWANRPSKAPDSSIFYDPNLSLPERQQLWQELKKAKADS